MLNNNYHKITELYDEYKHQEAHKQARERNIVNFLQEVGRLIHKAREKSNNK